jgi:hypothetical protein
LREPAHNVGMDGEIETRLAAAAEAMREYEIVVRRRDELAARAEELTRQISALQAQYDDEQHDVERLEGLSLTRVWAGLRGSREDDVARERAEADAARYRLAEARARLEAVSREHSAAEARRAELADAPAAYAAALDAKETYLRQSRDARGGQLLVLAEERGQLQAQLREAGEAMAAAHQAAQALGAVRAKLGSASDWSTYDTFLGGGLIGSAMKHSRMDEAAEAAAYADRCLLTLRAELADVGELGVTAPQVTTDGLTRFVDIWFDNIFTDLAVRNRITQAQESVEHSDRMVAEVARRLADREAKDRSRLSAIETEREALLTQT